MCDELVQDVILAFGRVLEPVTIQDLRGLSPSRPNDMIVPKQDFAIIGQTSWRNSVPQNLRRRLI